MKNAVLLLVAAVIFVFVGTALAVPPGKTVEFSGGAAGKVVFDGKAHADKGLKCADCHPKVFPMKKEPVKMAVPHKPGEYCGVCHNGTKAFTLQDNCAKCHKKTKPPVGC